MLLLLALLLLLMWLGGWLIAGVGNLVHILLVVAVIVIAFNFLSGRRGGGDL